MQDRAHIALDALAPSGARLRVWTKTPGEAQAVAEALHDANPAWRVRIDGRQPVFSRDGKIIDLVSSTPERV
jgi:hypothetical protein